MAWEENSKIKLMYFDGQQWKKAEGPQCSSAGARINIIIFKRDIFLTAQYGAVRSSIYKSSVDSALSDTTDCSRIVWHEVHGTLYSDRLSYISNLTVLGERIVMLDPQYQPHGQAITTRRMTLFATDHSEVSWEKLGELEVKQIQWHTDTYLSIIGVSNRKLLVIGNMDHDSRSSLKFTMLEGNVYKIRT